MTLLTAIGAQTRSVRLSANVFNLPLRPPAVLAKSVATLDLLTHGRAELGIGAGAFWDGIVAAGGERRTPGEAVEQLAEGIELVRRFWTGDPVDFDGTFYRSRGLTPGPVPAHDIPVWVGALKPRMLRLAGRVADGWAPSLGYAPPQAVAEMSRVIDEAALAAGRDPARVKRMYNVHGRFGTGRGLLEGTPANWAEQLTELVLTNGTSTFILATDDPRTLQTWAEEVAPQVRELVDVERERPEHLEPTPAAASAPSPAAPRTTPRSALRVTPTPDDGTRLSTRQVWDESTRPTFTEPEEADHPLEEAASHFLDVHAMLRRELDQVRDVLDQVQRGQAGVGAARSLVNEMTLRQNNWTLGAYCESYCRTVTGHHTLEDRGVFPHLRRAEPGLGPVLDRLEDEHHVIHDLLNAFDRALVGLVAADGSTSTTSDALERVRDELHVLTDALLSHFSYEERELLAPMARVGLN